MRTVHLFISLAVAFSVSAHFQAPDGVPDDAAIAYITKWKEVAIEKMRALVSFTVEMNLSHGPESGSWSLIRERHGGDPREHPASRGVAARDRPRA